MFSMCVNKIWIYEIYKPLHFIFTWICTTFQCFWYWFVWVEKHNRQTKTQTWIWLLYSTMTPTFPHSLKREPDLHYANGDWSNGFYFCIICGYKMSVSLNKDNCHKMKKQKLHPECVAEGMEQVLVVLHFIPVQLPAGGWADHQRKAVQHTLTHSVCAQNSERHTHTHTRQQWKKQWNPFHFWNYLQQKTVIMQIYGKHHEQREWHHPCWGAFAVTHFLTQVHKQHNFPTVWYAKRMPIRSHKRTLLPTVGPENVKQMQIKFLPQRLLSIISVCVACVCTFREKLHQLLHKSWSPTWK